MADDSRARDPHQDKGQKPVGTGSEGWGRGRARDRRRDLTGPTGRTDQPVPPSPPATRAPAEGPAPHRDAPAAGFCSYIAVGDSFTEGVGDPGPAGAFRGWADRLAALLADQLDPAPFGYANLAVRGRLLDQIVAEQVPRAVELAPDLVTFCAGGNDILRPGGDPDAIAERFEAAVADLTRAVGTVLVCTGFDTRGVPVLRHLRGKIATYTAHVRAIADRYDCPVLDLWSLRAVQDRRAWSADRLHLSPEGHVRVALRAAQVLGLDTPGDPEAPWPPDHPRLPSEVRRDNIQWAREYLVPWIGRRLRGQSSGDDVLPKRPDLLPLR